MINCYTLDDFLVCLGQEVNDKNRELFAKSYGIALTAAVIAAPKGTPLSEVWVRVVR